MAKKKLDSLMKESKIRDREDPDSFTIAALPPAGNDGDKIRSKVETFETFSLQCFPARGSRRAQCLCLSAGEK